MNLRLTEDMTSRSGRGHAGPVGSAGPLAMDGDRQSLVSGHSDITLTGDENSALEPDEHADSALHSVFSSSPAASVGRGSHNTPTSSSRRRAVYQVSPTVQLYIHAYVCAPPTPSCLLFIFTTA